MKFLVAPDKFKGSLTAEEVTSAIAKGIALYDPSAVVIPFPLADGGDGTARILTLHNHGRMIRVTVNNPVFEQVEAEYGISGDGRTAFMEMASASGLRLLTPDKQNCFHTSTLGTGEMLSDALGRGVKKIILGIGGSATNDAGIGMATALGYRFLDHQGNRLDPVGRNLIDIRTIDRSGIMFAPGSVEVLVACDVDNPLYGPHGAAYVYGPQKGASPEELDQLNNGLINFAAIVKSQLGTDIADIPGSGAAGGLGAGCMVFLQASLVPGIQLVMEQSGFEEAVRKCDLVITGEGKIDEQTFRGKVVDGVCRVAARHHKPVLAVCGQNNLNVIPPGSGIVVLKSLSEYFGSTEKAFTAAQEGLIRITREVLMDYRKSRDI